MQYNNIKTILRNAVTTGNDTDYLLFYDFYRYIYDIDVMYFIAENEIVQGTNVMILSDNGIKTESNIRAINFNRNFNKGLDPKSTDIKILKADDIIQGTFVKPEYKELEAANWSNFRQRANWLNFRHSEDYGRFYVAHDNCDKSVVFAVVDKCVTLYGTCNIFVNFDGKNIVDVLDECLAEFGADYIFVDVPITDDDIAAIDKYIGSRKELQCMVNMEKLQ